MVVYEEDTPLEVVRALVPDVLVKGADWAQDAIVGRAEVEAAGGRVAAGRAARGPLHVRARRAHPAPVSRTPTPLVTTLPEWLAPVAELPALATAAARLSAEGRVALSGAGGPVRALVPLLLAAPPLLVVVPRERDVEELAQDLRTLARRGGPAPAACSRCRRPGRLPSAGLPRHADASARRAAALLSASAGGARALVASPYGLLRPSLAPQLLETRVVSLRVGDEMTPEILLEALDEGGYQREDPVTAPGQVARRGGILDVFPTDADEPVRIEFFGDTVESLRRFDPDTQRASGPLDALGHAAARRRLRDPLGAEGAARRCSPSASPGRRELAAFLESPRARARCRRRWSSCCRSCQAPPCRPGHTCPPAPVAVIEPELVRREAEALLGPGRRGPPAARPRGCSPGARGGAGPARGAVRAAGRGAGARAVRAGHGRGADRGREPAGAALRGRPAPAGRRPARTAATTVVFLGNSGRADRLGDVLREEGSRSARARACSRGWVCSRAASSCPQAGLAVLADGDVFPEEVHLHARGRRRGLRSFLSDFRDLKTGDLVVHEEHGIGRFLGLETLEVGGATREFMVLGYQGGDKLKVPVEAFDRIQKYASAEGARPSIDQLGSGAWEKTKTRVKKAMRDMAKELLRLYAERKARPGHAFTGESPWQREFEEAFEYEETPDQAAGDRRRGRRHGGARADGPPGVRRRRLRQDRGRDARGHALRCSTASRWRCWRPPPCWPSSTGRPSASASRRSRSRSR